MRFSDGEIYHIFNRGNNRQDIFLKDAHYLLFLKKLGIEIAPHCNILSWCLMPNHFHLMIQATTDSCVLLPAYGGKSMQALANKIGNFLSSYTQKFNKEMGSTGSLFQQRTHARAVSELMTEESLRGWLGKYLTYLMHYIHRNPVRAGLVSKMEDWIYSSFRDYAGMRNGKLCHKEILLALTECTHEFFYEDSYGALSQWRSRT